MAMDGTRETPAIVRAGGRVVTGRRAGLRARAATVAPAVLIGIGLAGTFDEVVFHQLLHWHHFDDRSGLDRGLVSDGWFHIASTAVLVAGVAWAVWAAANAAFAVREGREGPVRGRGRLLTGGILVGAGGFNLYDGTIQHKVLRLHEIRPGVADHLPYDLVFNAVAATIVLVGFALLRSADRRASRPRQPLATEL